MMDDGIVVVIHDGRSLGIEASMPTHRTTGTVAPAWKVFHHVKPSPMSTWDQIKEAFDDWGVCMVDVVPFGMVVGEFYVRPHRITPAEFSFLLEHYRSWKDKVSHSPLPNGQF